MSYSSEILADTPAGYWKLDETSGTSAADASGNANAGTYTPGQRTGAAITLNQAGAAANTGTSVLFVFGTSGSGNDNRIDVSNAAALQLAAPFSLECWFRTPTTAVGMLLMAKYSTAGAFPGYGARVSAAGKVGFWFGDSTYLETAASYDDNAWHHAVFTHTGSTAKIYADGAEVVSAARSASLTNSVIFRIGCDDSLGSSWRGNLDEVAVYGSALSAARVLAHYNAATATGGARLRRIICSGGY